MGGVEDFLVAGIAVNRGHQTALDAEGLLEDLGHRAETIGGAAGVGDDLLVAGQRGVVHTKDDGGIHVFRGLGRNGKENLLGAAGQVLLDAFAVTEEAGGFQNDLDVSAGPVDVRGIFLGGDDDGLAVDDDGVVGSFDLAGEPAHDRVVLQQVCQGGGGDQVVDGDNFDVRVGGSQDAEDVATDAAEAIDTNLRGHERTPWLLGFFATCEH